MSETMQVWDESGETEAHSFSIKKGQGISIPIFEWSNNKPDGLAPTELYERWRISEIVAKPENEEPYAIVEREYTQYLPGPKEDEWKGEKNVVEDWRIDRRKISLKRLMEIANEGVKSE